jgi:hypothetical protein
MWMYFITDARGWRIGMIPGFQDQDGMSICSVSLDHCTVENTCAYFIVSQVVSNGISCKNATTLRF